MTTQHAREPEPHLLPLFRVDTARAVRFAHCTGGMMRRNRVEQVRGVRYMSGPNIGRPAADRPVAPSNADAEPAAGRNGLGFAGQTVPSGGSDP